MSSLPVPDLRTSRHTSRQPAGAALTGRPRRKALRAAATTMVEGLESRTMLAATPQIFFASDAPKRIPDFVPVDSVLPITGVSGTITDVDVTVNISHDWDADLTITLVSPNGIRIPLSDQNGGIGSNYTNTVFDSQAMSTIAQGQAPFTGKWAPDSPLTALTGYDPNGTWKLEVYDGFGGIIGTLNGWALTLTTTDDPAQVSGTLWNDTNHNGQRDTGLFAGARPDVVFAIDASTASMAPMTGAPVGDLNNDGTPDTILDAEIAGFTALNQDLITRGFGSTARVSVVVYADQAQNLNLNPVAGGTVLLSTSPAADLDANGAPDVADILATIQRQYALDGTSDSYSNYHAGLQQAARTFTSLNTSSGDGTVIFFAADDSSSGVYYKDLGDLSAAGIATHAFGAGATLTGTDLAIVDPASTTLASTDDVLTAFSDASTLVSYIEPPLYAWRVYADLNGNGSWDSEEPSTLTDSNGNYSFRNLDPGACTIGEVLLEDWVCSTPASGVYSVTIDPATPVVNQDFGNYQTGRISGYVFSDLNGNGYRDTNLILGAKPDVIIALDLSKGAADPFPGADVGDVNNDGLKNTILDVELNAIIALNNELMNRASGASTRIAILTFTDNSIYGDFYLNLLDPPPASAGTGGADTPVPAVPSDTAVGIRPAAEIEDTLRYLTPDRRSGTVNADYRTMLARVDAGFQTLGTRYGNANLLIFSHNVAPTGTGLADPNDVTNPLNDLRARGTNVHVFGVGDAAPLTSLQIISPEAAVYTDASVLAGAMDDKLTGTNISYIEPGLASVKLFLDTNNDGIQQEGEPATLTDSNGNYAFRRLDVGDYTAHQVAADGWLITNPAGGAPVETISETQYVVTQHFANVQTGSLSGTVFHDLDKNGVFGPGEPALSGVTVYLDLNNNHALDVGEPTAVTDADGLYVFPAVAPGTYNVRQVVPAGLGLASPFGGAYLSNINPGQTLIGLDFANAVPRPEIDILGGGRIIAPGSTRPSRTNLTDFGSIRASRGSRIFTYQIRNSGLASLLLRGKPLVSISGTNASDFRLVSSPSATVLPHSLTTFRILFDPRAVGTRTAWVTVTDNVAGRTRYRFAIRGAGLPDARTVRSASAATAQPRVALKASTLPFARTRRIADDVL